MALRGLLTGYGNVEEGVQRAVANRRTNESGERALERARIQDEEARQSRAAAEQQRQIIDQTASGFRLPAGLQVDADLEPAALLPPPPQPSSGRSEIEQENARLLSRVPAPPTRQLDASDELRRQQNLVESLRNSQVGRTAADALNYDRTELTREEQKLEELRRRSAAAPAAGRKAAPAQNLDSLFQAAGQKYGLDPALLKRLAETESSLNPQAVNRQDANGGSFGLMQINGQHLQRLGVNPQSVMDPAVNIDAGARILSEMVRAAGGDMGRALRMYKGVVSPEREQQYAPIIARVLGQQPGQPAGPAAAPAQGPQYQPGQAFFPGQAAPNQTLDRLRNDAMMLQRLAMVERDPARKLELIGKAQEMGMAVEETQLQQAASMAAQGSTQHLVALVQAANRDGSMQFGVADAGGGRVVFVRRGRDGQQVPSAPMTMRDAAGQLHYMLSSKLQQARMQAQAQLMTEYNKSLGKTMGELPGNEAKYANDRFLAEMNNNARLAEAVMKARVDLSTMKVTANTADGSYIMADGSGRAFLYRPSMPDSRGITSESAFREITASPMAGQ